MARILSAKPDKDGITRTVTVGYSTHRAGDKVTKVRALTRVEVAVQRVGVVLPIEEQNSTASSIGEKVERRDAGANLDKPLTPGTLEPDQTPIGDEDCNEPSAEEQVDLYQDDLDGKFVERQAKNNPRGKWALFGSILK